MDEKLMDKIIKDEIEKEDIVLPETINLKLKNAYKIIEKQEVNTNNHKKKKINVMKKTAVAATLTIGFLGVASFNPALADNIPGVSQLSKYLRNIYAYNDNMEKYADNINIVQDKNDMKISLEGVTYDESSLKFIYTITSKKKLQWGVQMTNTSLKIDGKELMNYERKEDSSFVDNKRNGEFDIDDVKIEDTEDGGEKYAVINSYDISDLRLGNNIDIDWTLNDIHVQDGNYNKGPWEFKFKTSKEKLMANSRIIDVNHAYDVDGYKYTIDKVIISPVEIKVLSTTDERIYNDMNEVEKKIEEKSKNKRDNYEPMNISIPKLIEGLEDNEENKQLKERYYKLQIINSKLSELEMASIINENGEKFASMVTGKGYKGNSTSIYKPLKDELPKKISFIPSHDVDAAKECEDLGGSGKVDFYNRYIEDKYEYSMDTLKAGMEYKQGKNMTILVNSVTRTDNELKVNYSYKGDFKEIRGGYRDITLIPSNIKIEKSDDKMYYEDILDKMSPYDKYKEVGVGTREVTFNVAKDEKFRVLVNKVKDGHFIKDEVLTIDVK